MPSSSLAAPIGKPFVVARVPQLDDARLPLRALAKSNLRARPFLQQKPDGILGRRTAQEGAWRLRQKAF